jgi:chemotaxis protein histidine kinase CheA
MAENKFLFDLNEQLQEETLEIITHIKDELAKLEMDLQNQVPLKKILRLAHALHGPLKISGHLIYLEHFENLEKLIGFILVNRFQVSTDLLKLIGQSIRLGTMLFEKKLTDIEIEAQFQIKDANIQISKMLSELKKNRKPLLKLDPDLKDDFINDSRKHLAIMSVLLGQFDPSKSQEDCISSVFRSLHTLKSSASMYGYKPIEELIHEFESILSLSRDENVPLNLRAIQLFQSLFLNYEIAIDELLSSGTPSWKMVDQFLLLIEDVRQYYAGLLFLKNTTID